MNLWERFTSRYLITATLIARTGIRVGAGRTDMAHPTASDLPVLVGNYEQPYIPGSSLRGVFRSQIERFVRTLEPHEPNSSYDGKGACNPAVDQEWCIPSDLMNKWRTELRAEQENVDVDGILASRVAEHSCRVCQTFGNPWLASRVRFTDLHLNEYNRFRVELRDGVAIDREKETVKHKYDFEALSAGVAFELKITLENLNAVEMGMVWLGIRELEDGNILVGGFKGRGLGRVSLEGLRVSGVDANDRAALRRYITTRTYDNLTPEQEQFQADNWLEAFLSEVGS